MADAFVWIRPYLKRIGTQKSNISRFENGSCNPSLDFLAKVAHGLGKELHIELR